MALMLRRQKLYTFQIAYPERVNRGPLQTFWPTSRHWQRTYSHVSHMPPLASCVRFFSEVSGFFGTQRWVGSGSFLTYA